MSKESVRNYERRRFICMFRICDVLLQSICNTHHEWHKDSCLGRPQATWQWTVISDFKELWFVSKHWMRFSLEIQQISWQHVNIPVFTSLTAASISFCGSGVISHEICNHEILLFWSNISCNLQPWDIAALV